MKQHKIYFNSKDRITGTTNNLNYQLTTTINNVSAISISKLRFPITYYNVSTKNNIFKIEDNKNNIVDVVITLQNYSATELVSEVQTKLNSSSLSGNFTITYSAKTGKFTISCNHVFKIYINEFSKFLGFKQTTAFGLTHTADNMSNLAPAPVYIRTDLQLNSELAGQQQNIVYEVSGDVSFGSILYDNEKPTENIELMKKKNISNLKFELVDGDGDTIENNGIDYSMIVTLFYNETENE